MKGLWGINSLFDCEIFSKEELALMLEYSITDIEKTIRDWYKEDWGKEYSLSSYQKEMLDYLGTLCDNLEGSYNNEGIKRWFRRRRKALGGLRVLDIICALEYNTNEYIPNKHHRASEDELEEIMELSMVHAEAT